MLDEFLQMCYTDNGHGNGHAIPSQLAKFWNDVMNGGFTPEDNIFHKMKFLAIALISTNRKNISHVIDNYYDTAQQYAQMSPWQLHQEGKSLGSFSAGWSKLKKLRYLHDWTIPLDFNRINFYPYIFDIEGRSLILTLAVLRYQLDNNALPQTLHQLKEAGYISSIPIDPFSGKEIVYKLIDEGFTLYSFGSDFDDDGGKVESDKMGKPKMWATENGDVVFWPVGNAQK
ncbi:MAG: hypothetical protein JW806_10660 [Sedimentisphaerales bacterium]|nr:hypothetical protein [Sedimentisphaerales bacterium]